MKKLFPQLLATYLIFGCVCTVHATDECVSADRPAITSLHALPPEVVNLLRSEWSTGRNDIADAGEPFNWTDASLPESPPMRRFVSASASASADCLHVTIEHGGRPYGFRSEVFRHQGGTWRRTDSHELSAPNRKPWPRPQT
jgi:hypothetical protein